VQCIVTAGPTYEPLDEVRRLTNLSTGRLGGELAGFLTSRGHSVTLLMGDQATWPGERRADRVETFTTTADLRGRLEAKASEAVDAVFHAAAVSDFRFGRVWQRSAEGGLIEVKADKIPTPLDSILVELEATGKIIGGLRSWFRRAFLVGWKYEMDGDHGAVIAKAVEQIRQNRTDACVANGRAYGEGFGLVTPEGRCSHFKARASLFKALAGLVRSSAATRP
jgi:phosphopantothenate---cysteine ligase (CTP)